MNASASLCTKVLSLAVVLWAVMSTHVLSAQGAGWVPWAAFLLLMLLEAYSSDSKPAAWSQWAAGLRRIVGPGMLPYYAVLAALLAFGPDQVRHSTSPGVPPYSGYPTGRPGVFPNQYPGGQPAPARQMVFPGTNAPPRPTTSKPPAPGQPGVTSNSAPSIPSKFSINPTKVESSPVPAQPSPSAPKPVQVLPSSQPPAQLLPSAPPSAQAPASPTSSAKPPPSPGK
jgi:hypothetical protein